MDHFALPDDDLARAQARGSLHRNFMGYTTHADSDLIGLGVSAISHIGDSFSQNPRDLPAWEAAVDQGRLPVFARPAAGRGRPACARDLIQQLMCQRRDRPRADRSAATPSISTSTSPTRWRGSRRWRRTGWCTFDGSRIAATSRGRLLLRNIAMCFDRYLRHRPLPKRSHATPARI